MRLPIVSLSCLALISCAADVQPLDDADAVASVMLVQGSVRVVHGEAQPASAQVGQLLYREDIVWTDPGSAAVLHLKNNHLVRVDEDLQLEVANIVLLDAPSSDVPASDQLAGLLYPDERQNMPGYEQAQRVSGWQSRLRAGQSVGSLDDDAAGGRGARHAAEDNDPGDEMESAPAPQLIAELPKREAATERRAADAEPPPPKEQEPLPETEDALGGVLGNEIGDDFGAGGLGLSGKGTGGGGTAEGIGNIGTISRGGGGGEGSGYGAGPRSGETTAPPPKSPFAMRGNEQAPSADKVVDMPDEAQNTPTRPAPWSQTSLQASIDSDGDLRTCLVTYAKALPVEVEELKLTVVATSGSIDRLVMGGGLMPPACAREALVGKAAEDGRWTVMVKP